MTLIWEKLQDILGEARRNFIRIVVLCKIHYYVVSRVPGILLIMDSTGGHIYLIQGGSDRKGYRI